jgi:hypothetical protein
MPPYYYSISQNKIRVNPKNKIKNLLTGLVDHATINQGETL